MTLYHFHLSDGKQANMSLDVENEAEALNIGLNALSQYVCKEFPPPDKVEISIASERGHIATLRFLFEVVRSDDEAGQNEQASALIQLD